MLKEELHDIIREQQPNICQIVALKDNSMVYSDTWTDYKQNDNVHITSVTKRVISETATFKPSVYNRIEFIREFIEPFILNDKV